MTGVITKIGILSDTHSALDPDIHDCLKGCPVLLHAGDIGNAEVLRVLSGGGRKVISVRGNNDTTATWAVKDRHLLGNLEDVAVLPLPGGEIVMEHGHRIWDTRNYHLRLREKYPDARAIVYGHTHIQVVDTRCQPWVLNPGAAGRENTKQGPSCLILTVNKQSWSVESLIFEKKPVRAVV